MLRLRSSPAVWLGGPTSLHGARTPAARRSYGPLEAFVEAGPFVVN